MNQNEQNLDRIDFINTWDIYQKIYYQTSNQMLQTTLVDSKNMMEELDFNDPG